jgi:hypothetical protein
MSTTTINGVLGDINKPNSPSVRFNLTTNSQSSSVHGTVQIMLDNPEIEVHTGNVTGTSYTMGPDQMIQISGLIQVNELLHPHLEIPFQANMAFEANDKGVGGFNFMEFHLESLPVIYRKEDL